MKTQDINLFIDHVHFKMDMEHSRLYQESDPENTISLDSLKDEGGYYSCLFDKAGSNLFHGVVGTVDDLSNVLPVVIPKEVFDGDKNMLDSINFESQISQWHIYLADEETMQRLHGVLPEIDIAGQDYIVDLNLGELIHSEDPKERINLKRLVPSPDGTEYHGFYNVKTGSFAEPLSGDEDIEELMLVQIPYELKLDPIGVARQRGLKDTELIMVHPRRDRLKATIVAPDEDQKRMLKKRLEDLRNTKLTIREKRNGFRL